MDAPTDRGEVDRASLEATVLPTSELREDAEAAEPPQTRPGATPGPGRGGVGPLPAGAYDSDAARTVSFCWSKNVILLI